MFEDMAIRCYKQINNNIPVHIFGIIQNKNIEHFGASPDGITDLGIMVEIKCPFSRQIKKDFIPEKYYYQMQGQLAVCNLTECDYVECEFKIFRYELFRKDHTANGWASETCGDGNELYKWYTKV